MQCLDRIFMVLQMSELAKIGAMRPMFLDSGSPRRGKALKKQSVPKILVLNACI